MSELDTRRFASAVAAVAGWVDAVGAPTAAVVAPLVGAVMRRR